MTIPPSNAASEYCFDVDIRDDSVVEPNEEFVLSFQVPTGIDGEAGSVTSTTVTIVDDDGQLLWVYVVLVASTVFCTYKERGVQCIFYRTMPFGYMTGCFWL